MTGKTLVMAAISVSVVLGAGAVLSRAGNLVPPAGAIEPTMLSLQDVKVSLDNLGVALNVPTPVWEYAWGEVSGGTTSPSLTLVQGSGVLKQVVVSGQGKMMLSDGNGGSIIVGLNLTPSETHTIPLNVRYSTGLHLFVPSSYQNAGSMTVVFAPDPGQ